MRIPERGLDEATLFDTLERYREHDLPWREGRVYGYVFDAGREAERIGKEAFTRFMSLNALDPTVYPSVLRLENEVVAMSARHLGGDEHVVGNFTSGGTESIILAVKAAREHARARGIEHPTMVLPVTAHAAFHKAANYLGVEAVVIGVDTVSFRACTDQARDAIDGRTALLVASAPSYAHGVIDPIADLAAIATERGVLFHVDACIGGFLLPYFRRLGREVPPFDFSVPGVTSMSMDLHKYAYCPKGASVVLYRNKDLRRHQIFACASWCGYTMVNTTVQSTKSAGPMAAAWAVLRYLGDDAYLEIAKSLDLAARRIVEGIGAIEDLRVLGSPDMSLVAFASDTRDVFSIADRMRKLGWYVQPTLGLYDARLGELPCHIHLSINPSNVPHTEALLRDLAAAAAEAPCPDAAGIGAAIRHTFASMRPAAVDDQVMNQMLGMVGMQSFGLPEDTAAINTALDALPPALKERLLTTFVNELFTQPA